MESEPLGYASSNETRPKRRRTNFGAIALILCSAFVLLDVADEVLPRGVRFDGVHQHISDFNFDYGFPYMLVTLVVLVVGLFQHGRSRWMSIAAFLLPFAVGLLTFLIRLI